MSNQIYKVIVDSDEMYVEADDVWIDSEAVTFFRNEDVVACFRGWLYVVRKDAGPRDFDAPREFDVSGPCKYRCPRGGCWYA